MGAAREEAGVPGRGELFDGFADVLSDAANDPVGKEVDSSGRGYDITLLLHYNMCNA